MDVVSETVEELAREMKKYKGCMDEVVRKLKESTPDVGISQISSITQNLHETIKLGCEDDAHRPIELLRLEVQNFALDLKKVRLELIGTILHCCLDVGINQIHFVNKLRREMRERSKPATVSEVGVEEVSDDV